MPTPVTVNRDDIILPLFITVDPKESYRTIHYPFELFTISYETGVCILVRGIGSNMCRLVKTAGHQFSPEKIQQILDQWDAFKVETDILRTEVDEIPLPQTGA